MADIVGKFARAGTVFNADFDAKVYSVITHEWALAPAVVSFVARKDTLGEGTTRQQILDHLHGDFRLGRVPESRVDATIGRLIGDSVLYEADSGILRLV